MNISVKLFAQARQLAGKDEVTIEVSERPTTSTLLDELCIRVPELSNVKATLLVAVNNQFASAETVIQPGDAVACFPPVSGG